MALHPELPDLRILFGGVLAVLHVPKMILQISLAALVSSSLCMVNHLALDVVFVDIREVILGKLKRDGEELVQRIQHLAVKRLETIF